MGAHTAPARSGAQALSLLLHQAQHGASTPTAASWVKMVAAAPSFTSVFQVGGKGQAQGSGDSLSRLGLPPGALLEALRGTFCFHPVGPWSSGRLGKVFAVPDRVLCCRRRHGDSACHCCCYHPGSARTALGVGGGSQNPRDGWPQPGKGTGESWWLWGWGFAQSGSFSPYEILEAGRHVSRIPQMRFREVECLPRVTQLVSDELASPQLA